MRKFTMLWLLLFSMIVVFAQQKQVSKIVTTTAQKAVKQSSLVVNKNVSTFITKTKSTENKAVIKKRDNANVTKSTKQITGSIVCNTYYVAGTTMDLNFTLNLTNTDFEYGDYLELTFPAGITPNSSPTDPFSTATEGQNSEALNGVSGQTISWGDDDNTYGGIEPAGSPFTFIVNVTIGAISGDQAVNYLISGDGYGSTPGDLSGTVILQEPPACMPVTSLNASSITTSSASLSWTNGGTEANWNIEYGPAGFTQSTGTEIAVTTNPYTLSGLSAATAYDFYVQADCGGTVSPWAGPYSFNTLCNVFATNFTEGFEATAAPPVCWTMEYANATPPAGNLMVHTTAQFYAGARSFRFSSYATGSPYNQYLISPELNFAVNKQLTFWYRKSNTDTETFSVGTSTTGNDYTTDFTWGADITDASNTAWTQYTAIIPAGTKYISIQYKSDYMYYLYVDEFSIQDAPACAAPTALAASGITQTAATLSWINGGTETNWNIEYGATGFTQGTGTEIAVTTNPYTLSVLTAGTTYDYYVQADCGGDISTWVGPFTFSTLCDPITAFPYAESFEAGVPPSCWSKVNNDGGTGWESISSGTALPGWGTATLTASDGSNVAYCTYTTGGTASNDQWLISPQFTIPANQQLTFDMFLLSTYADNVDVKVSTTGNAPADFTTTLLSVTEADLTATSWTSFTIDLSAYAGQDIFIAFNEFVADNQTDGDFIALDKFQIADIPACAAPTTLAASGITQTTASLSWVNGGTEANWNIEYGPTGFTQSTGTEIAVTTNPYTLTGLTAATTYDYYVQADCGADQSTWVGPFTFSTLCDPITAFPYAESFEAGVPPSCWSKVNLDSGTGWESISSGTALPGWGSTLTASDGNNVAYCTYTTGGAASNDQWLITPQFSMPAGYKLSFDMFLLSTYADNVDIKVSTTGNQPADFTTTLLSITEADLTATTWTTFEVDLSAYAGQDIFIAFNEFVADNQTDGDFIGLDNVKITNCDLQFVSITSVDATCNGLSTGSADLTYSGGISPVTFAWSNAATTEDLTNVAAGTYSVVITDANGCTANGSTTINEPGELSSTISVWENDFSNPADWTITNNVGNTDDWTIGTTGPSGSYAIPAILSTTAANGYALFDSDLLCSGDQNADLTTTNPINLTTSNNVILQFEQSYRMWIDSTFIFVSNNGTDWTKFYVNETLSQDEFNLGGNPEVVNIDISSVAANQANVWIKFNFWSPAGEFGGGEGCGYAWMIDDIKLLSNDFAVLCNGDAVSQITASANGGTAPYTYNWNDTYSTEGLSNVAAGTYNLTITDANGCTSINSALISEPAAIIIGSTVTNVTCYGLNNGSIDLTVSGGTSPYSFAWDNAAISEDITNLAPGSYAVTVTDANGCHKDASFTITEPSELIASVSGNDVLCFGGTTAITVTATGGTTPYTGTGSFTEVAGTYNYTVTDANGCSDLVSITVNEPAALSVSANITDATCGATDGVIDLTVTGGTTPYSFIWASGATTEDRTNLGAGIYSVTVKDVNNCSYSDSYQVFNPGSPTIDNAAITNVLCYGQSTGAIDITVSGGAAPLTFAWSNLETTEDISTLSAGTYEITITDNAGCVANELYVITENTEITATTGTYTEPTCNGNSDGSIGISVTGGVAPYSYLWGGGETAQDLTFVPANTYSVTVTDNFGCQSNFMVTLNEPAVLSVSLNTLVNNTCFGETNGSIDIDVTGGTPAYTYAWDSGDNTQDLSSISAGTYNLTVTDANGCTKTDSYVITEGAEITNTYVVTDITCYGGSNGAIDLTVSGGTGTYTYNWSNTSTDEDITGLTAGDYIVTITDSNNCTAIETITVSEPMEITATFDITNVSCNGLSDGAIDMTVSGGTGVYTYDWTGAITTEDLTNLVAGTYDVTITDENFCVATGSAIVSQPDAIDVSAIITNVSCNGGSDGAMDITVTGGSTPYTFLWSTGATTEDITGLIAGVYTGTVTDANGCTFSGGDVITEPTVLTISATTPADISCYGGSTEITIDAAGGTTPYTGTGTFTVYAGTNSFTVTDANGCMAETTTIITEPEQLVIDTLSTTPATSGTNTDGAIYTITTGGTTPYTYVWSNSATTENLIGVATGYYDVTVVDNNGCIASMTNIFIDFIDAIYSFNTFGINIYPNPTSDFIKIESNEKATIQIVNMLGEVVYSLNNSDTINRIDLSNFANGTYMVKLQIGENMITRTVVLKK